MPKTVIGYEGLLGTGGQWLWHGLLRNLKADVRWRGWLAWGRPECDIVIGHSFGCRAAVQTKAKVCILIDPVVPPFGIGRYTARPDVPTICIWQRRSMPSGHAVAGADNIEISDGTRHTALPGHSTVAQIVSRHL